MKNILMKKLIWLCLFSFVLFFACKKSKPDPVEFKFIQAEGNISSATNAVLKVAWQDDNNTSWNIILYNLTDGTKKTISTNTKFITETVIIGNEYKVVPIGVTKPIDTINPCSKSVIPSIISTMPNLFNFTPSVCPTTGLAVSSISAGKTSATQAFFAAGFVSAGNTSWKVKVTNTVTGVSQPIVSTAIVETGNITIPLDATQQIEITGDQDGAKAGFKIKVESNQNVVVSDFY